MLQGPSAGPSMLLNIMMRWPVLIPIATISTIGVYKLEDLKALIDPSIQQVSKTQFEVTIQKPLAAPHKTPSNYSTPSITTSLKQK